MNDRAGADVSPATDHFVRPPPYIQTLTGFGGPRSSNGWDRA